MVDQPLSQLHMVEAARRYYLDDASKVQIAQEMGLSRFKVARLLESARDEGIVRIEVIDPTAIRDKLSRELTERFGLKHAIVVDTEGLSSDDGLDELGRQAGELLARLVQPTDVIGLPWSRMVSRAVAYFTGIPPIPMVQLSGALDLPGTNASPVDVVRDAARLTGGEAHVFYAPLVADTASAAQVIRAQAAVTSTLTEARHCSLALVGIGAWAPSSSTLFDLASEEERAELDELDVVGEVAGSFFNRAGSPLNAGLSQRLVTIEPKHLLMIPSVIALSHGAERAQALMAAIRGSYVNSVVVDTALAHALLDLSDV